MFNRAIEKVDFLKCPQLQELIQGLPVVVWSGEDTKEGIINRVYVGVDTKNKAYVAVSLQGHNNLFRYCIKDFKDPQEGMKTFIDNYLYYLSLVGYKDYYKKPERRIPSGLFNRMYIWTCKTGNRGVKPRRVEPYQYYKHN